MVSWRSEKQLMIPFREHLLILQLRTQSHSQSNGN